MNEFFADYLKKIVPVTFALESEGKRQIIGDGEVQFTVKLKPYWEF
ncbi:MAG: hypothetical protein ACLRZ7_13930 [Lachnospiraceae bacterium]